MEKALAFLRIQKDIAFATTTDKEVYSQLKQNSYAEFLAIQGQLSVRVSGKVNFNIEDEICREIYENNKILQRLYASYKDLIYFKFITNKFDYYDLTSEPPILESYDIF